MDPAARQSSFSVAAFWLALLGSFWMVLALDTAPWVLLLTAAFVPASLLCLRALGQIRSAAARLPKPLPRLARNVGRLCALEPFAIVIAANAAARWHAGAWTAPLVAVIVALFLLALARMLRLGVLLALAAFQLAAAAAATQGLRGHLDLRDIVLGWALALSLWVAALHLLARAPAPATA